MLPSRLACTIMNQWVASTKNAKPAQPPGCAGHPRHRI